MDNIIRNKNNIDNYEIELTENFISEKNRKNLNDYTLIPSNPGKITNIDIVKQYHSNNRYENNNDIIRENNFFPLLFSNIKNFTKKIYMQLSFNWSFEIIKKGNTKKLTKASFKDIPPNYSAGKLFNDIFQQYNKNHNKNNTYILLKILLKIHCKKLILASILLLITTLFDFGGIIIYNELLRRFNKGEENNESLFNLNKISLLKLIIYMIIYAPITYICYFQSSFLCDLINSISESQLNCLIYDKILKMATYIQNNFNQGKILNLMQSDSCNFGNLISSYPELFGLPFKITYSIIILFKFYGFNSIPCLIILIILFFLFFHFGKKQTEYENALMEIRDKKMNIISQTFNIIKIIKLYVWEKLFIKKIEKVKEEENIIMKKKARMTLIVNSSYWNTESILILITVIFYFLQYQNIDYSKILTTMFLFYNIIDPLYCLPSFITNLNDTLISLKRIKQFLEIQEYDKSHINYLDDNNNLSINIENISFGVLKKSYNEEKNEFSKSNNINDKDEKNNDENNIKLLEDYSKEFIEIKLLNNIEIKIKKGEHIGVIGKVGSGKSCLLNSFINNLAIISDIDEKMNKNKIIYTSKKISYVTQNPWILNDTFKNNIIYFNKIDDEKYNKIISICQLEPDLKIIKGGDKIEIGEKGINLSGGQKMRLAIARAIYCDAEIYIFDDPLSALDAYVGMNLFKKVFCEYLKNKTIIISTHSLQYLNLFDKIIFMEEGKIRFFGPTKELFNLPFYLEFSKQIENLYKNDYKNKKEEDNDINKQNIYEDNSSNEIIKVNNDLLETKNKKKSIQYFDSFIFFIKFSGGINFCIKVLAANIAWKVSQLLSDFYISRWAKQNNVKNKFEINYKVFIFSIISLVSIFGVIIRQKLMDDGLIRFNIKMHNTLIEKLIYASLNLFHNITPKGKIYNLFNRDLEDSSTLNLLISRYLRNIFQILGSLIVCFTFNKWTFIIIILIFYIEYLITKFYLPSSNEITNLEANSRSPILGVFEETLSGIAIIRCTQKQKKFTEKFYDKVNDHFMICLYQNGIFYWLIIHLNIISNLLSGFILVFCYIFKYQYDSQSLGLLLKYSILFSDQIFEIMIGFNDFAKNLACILRCIKYTKIPQEKYINLNKYDFPRDNIFHGGKICFQNYNVKYGPKDPLTLKNLSFNIGEGEKIGVVGRTGSGKTTLGLCLFRILEADSGKIIIDGKDISAIDLISLRKNISIIPQEPILIEGSLRENIDPYNQYSDSEINVLINEIGLENFMKDKNMDYIIEENGANLSLGEKQLICIARAFLKKNKIILMDEATSSIDLKTENKIQNAITKFMKNCTVITIAHRIKTIINYDKILVLSNGEIIEFDTPQKLLDKKGLFFNLYKESIRSSS